MRVLGLPAEICARSTRASLSWRPLASVAEVGVVSLGWHLPSAATNALTLTCKRLQAAGAEEEASRPKFWQHVDPTDGAAVSQDFGERSGLKCAYQAAQARSRMSGPRNRAAMEVRRQELRETRTLRYPSLFRYGASKDVSHTSGSMSPSRSHQRCPQEFLCFRSRTRPPPV